RRHGDVPQVRLPGPFRARGSSARSDAVLWAREIPAPQAHTRPDAPDNDSTTARESDIVAGSTGHLGYLCGRPLPSHPHHTRRIFAARCWANRVSTTRSDGHKGAVMAVTSSSSSRSKSGPSTRRQEATATSSWPFRRRRLTASETDGAHVRR